MSESPSNAANQDDTPIDNDVDGLMSSFEQINMEDVPKQIQEHGLIGIEEFFRGKLEKWKDVEINIGVTGNAGSGKSSFINAMRG